MKVLILGKGYISNFLVDIFKGKGYKVDNFSRKELDYTDDDELYSVISTEPYEAVINTAGFTGKPNVDECEIRRQECFNLNVKLPKTIENICKLCDVNFVHISSGCIYTGYEKEYTEEDEPNFGLFNDEASFYSKTKHAGEMMLDDQFTNIIRIRMPIEDKLSPKNLLTKLLKYDFLIDFSEEIIRYAFNKFNIHAPVYRTSKLNLEGHDIYGIKTDLILNMCKAANASTFVFGEDGKKYIEKEKFNAKGINYVFQKFNHPEYTQRYSGFESHMSFIDILFNHGPESKNMLGKIEYDTE